MQYNVTVLAFLLVITGSGAWAQNGQPVPTLSVLPSSGFSFVGTWECSGTFRKGQTHKSAFTGTMALDGKWLELTEEDHVPSTGYKAKYLIGYEGVQKTLMEFDANTFGAAVYTSAKGWQGNILTMTSVVPPGWKVPDATDRFLYTVTGANTFSVDWQVSKTGTLTWATRDHLECKHR